MATPAQAASVQVIFISSFASFKPCVWSDILIIWGWGGGSFPKGWLAIAKLKPLSLFISLLSMPKKAFDNVKQEK